MENETVTKTKKKSTSTKKTQDVVDTEPVEIIESEPEKMEWPKKESAKKPIVPKEVDLNQIITVRNGFQGKLIYKSSRTGEKFVWDSFGAEQDMELGELRNARNSAKSYFINNWFMFDESWVIDYLGMKQYYKYAVSIDDFDKIFEKTPTEVAKIIENMSDGQKKSLSYRARVLIAEGAIDSNKLIATLEKSLGTELIER